jgi:GLPGLI family protein
MLRIKKTIFLLFSIVSFGLVAQEGKISYVFTVGGKASFNSTLEFKNQESFYFLDVDNPIKEEIIVQKKVEENKGINNNVIEIDIKDGKKFFVYKNFLSNEQISREVLYNGDKVILNDSIRTINWQIHSIDKKIIGGVECQRATANFRCADYTAWFAPSIPLRFGPWKLGGLPGLIFELVNETVNHSYLISGLELFTIPKIKIDSKETLSHYKDKRMNYQDFVEKQRIELKKMELYLKGISKSSEGQFKAKLPECFE